MHPPDDTSEEHPFNPAPDAPAGPSVFVLGINRNPPPEAAAAPLGEFIRGAVAEAASRPPMFTKPPPPSASGLDLNFCKSTACQNFGNPASAAASGYKLEELKTQRPRAVCKSCGESFTLKNNDAIAEEIARIGTLARAGLCGCPDPACANHGVSVDAPDWRRAYQSFGKTLRGAQRYRCRRCKRTFSPRLASTKPTGKQQQTEKNIRIFELLVNRMPLRRICKVLEINPRTLYDRIDFLHRQAVALLDHYESRLPGLAFEELQISVDRQEHPVNWVSLRERRNTRITALASADNASGYVFAVHPNFDETANPAAVEQDVLSTSAFVLPAPWRIHARLWTEPDWALAAPAKQASANSGSLLDAVAARYSETQARQDVDAPELDAASETLPGSGGMLIHSEYTFYGHFERLRQLLPGARKITFYLDQESGIRAACHGIFAERIKQCSVDAFYIRISKGMTQGQKLAALRAATKKFEEIRIANPGLNAEQVAQQMMKDAMATSASCGKWNDRWVTHPQPNINEPEKASCFLTERGCETADEIARMHRDATLMGVDVWFNRVRRRCSLFERPIGSAANGGRVWHGYAPYNPAQVGKLLTLLRLCHNYLWVPDDLRKADKRETPAMRLGLVDKPLTYADVAGFQG